MCGQWNIVRHSRPGLRRVDAGDRLQQARREILSTDILDGIDELVDAQVGGVDLFLTSGQHSEVVGPVSPNSCDVVRLGWLTGGRSRPQQAQLVLGGCECRFKMRAEAPNLAANALELVTEVVQLRIAQARLLQVALQARKLLLPTRDPLLDVNADTLVGTCNDLGRVDWSGRRFCWLRGSLRTRRRTGLRNHIWIGRCRCLRGLSLSAGHNQQGKEAQRPRYKPQSADHRLLSHIRW